MTSESDVVMTRKVLSSMYECGYADALKAGAKALRSMERPLGLGAIKELAQLFQDEADTRLGTVDSTVKAAYETETPLGNKVNDIHIQ